MTTALRLFHLTKLNKTFPFGFLFSLNLRIISVQDIEVMTSFRSFLEPLGKAKDPYISSLVFVCPPFYPLSQARSLTDRYELGTLQCHTNSKANKSIVISSSISKRGKMFKLERVILVLIYYICMDLKYFKKLHTKNVYR